MGDSLDDPDLLPVAARELAEGTAQIGAEPLRERARESALADTPEILEQVEQLLAADPLVEREVARQVAGTRPDRDAVAPDVQAEDTSFPSRRPQQPEQRPDRGRLAGAVGAQESEDLTGPDLERQRLDAARLAVELAELLRLNDRRAQAVASAVCSPAPAPAVALAPRGSTITGHGAELITCRASEPSRTRRRGP